MLTKYSVRVLDAKQKTRTKSDYCFSKHLLDAVAYCQGSKLTFLLRSTGAPYYKI